MTGATTHRLTYPLLVIAAAVCVLVLLADSGAATLLERTGMTRAAKRKVAGKITNSLNGKAVINVRGARPGASGTGRVTIRNAGRIPFSKVLLSQDNVQSGGMSAALQLQIYDTSTKRCLYPRPKVKKVKPGKRWPREKPVCASWQPFNGGKALNKLLVPGAKQQQWAKKEQHVIEVRWRLDASSPNSDMGRSARFRLRWRALQ